MKSVGRTQFKILYHKGMDFPGVATALNKEINEYIMNGWAPVGGVSAHYGHPFHYASQSMYKYSNLTAIHDD